MIQVKAVAGPEMDAAVAQHVMGWTGIHVDSIAVPGIGGGIFPLDMLVGTPPEGKQSTVPRFSRDIASAWAVVEKVRLQLTPCGTLWFAAVMLPADELYQEGRLRENRNNADHGICVDEWLDGACAATAPLAICCAALRSVGVEVGE